MNSESDCVVGNRDMCGRCRATHGGNNHRCPVHGNVSAGCCTPPCDPTQFVRIPDSGPIPISAMRGARAVFTLRDGREFRVGDLALILALRMADPKN